MLPHFVVDALKAHRVHQNEMRLHAGDTWQDQDLVFCNRHGGFLHPDGLLRKFHTLLSEAGLPSMRLHDLRHNIATLLTVKVKNPCFESRGAASRLAQRKFLTTGHNPLDVF